MYRVLPQKQQNRNAANESVIQEMVKTQMETLNIDELKGFWENIIDEYGGLLPESQKGSLYDFISGEKELSIRNG